MQAMLEKAVDAGSMFWASLDERERLMILYLGACVAWTVVSAIGASEERKREDRIVARLRGELVG